MSRRRWVGRRLMPGSSHSTAGLSSGHAGARRVGRIAHALVAVVVGAEHDVTCSGVDRFARLEHGDELCQAPGARLGLLGVLEPVEDRVAVLAAEPGEECLRRRPRVELALEIIRDRGAALAGVGGVPAAVRLGALDLGVSSGPHSPLGDQLLRLGPIDLRPPPARPTRRIPLEEVALVERFAAAVYPAEAERDLNRLGVKDGLDARVLLGHLDPYPVRYGVMVLEPLLPLSARAERHHGKAVVSAHADRVNALGGPDRTPTTKSRKLTPCGN